jgi:4-amino-4-deoxy-L-arabinose transferase-like glycosyltransferase
MGSKNATLVVENTKGMTAKKKFKLTVPTSLIVILLLGLFLRIYKFSSFFQFGHEQDLQAWIVKDILADKHPRLIGQETSIVGLFIGPLYYYLLVPFFAAFRMDPRASIIPITAISMTTIASVYFVLRELFSKKTGTAGALLYAVSPAIVFLDRWAVPTQPTLLWAIWFFYVLMKFVRSEFGVSPILIILIGLIWHIHIALVPLLFLVPIAFWVGRKENVGEIGKKKLKMSLVVAAILLIPFVAFEFRHNFQQARGLLGANKTRAGQARELREGYYKVEVIAEYMNRVAWSPILYQKNLKNPMVARIPLTLFVYLGLVVFLYKKKKLSKEEMTLMLLWIAVIFASLMFSKRIISDYYFNNLMIISVVIFSLLFSYSFSKKTARKLALLLGFIFVIFSFNNVAGKENLVGEFKDKLAIVGYIAENAEEKKYPCIAINYIGNIGVSYGYRYLFWWKGVSQITPANDVPVYSIVRPFGISESEVVYRSGDIGVILPRDPQIPNESLCNNANRQLLPLNGFVN